MCDLIQTPHFSFQDYAQKENLSFDDLTNTMRPLLYASAVSCMSTGLMIAGGSNLAKFMYYKNVLSRREEATAKRNGGDNASTIRRNALEKKIRQTRNQDIRQVSGEMVHKGITKLEEDALVMEFATGVAMEQHYDLVAHDDLMAEVQKAAERERLQGDAGRGLSDLSKLLGGDDDLDMELDLAKINAAGGALAAGAAGAAALKEANQLKQLQLDLQKIAAKLQTAKATMEGRVSDIQGQLKEQAPAQQARGTLAVEEAGAEAAAMQQQTSGAGTDEQAQADAALDNAQTQITETAPTVSVMPNAEDTANMTKQQQKDAQKKVTHVIRSELTSHGHTTFAQSRVLRSDFRFSVCAHHYIYVHKFVYCTHIQGQVSWKTGKERCQKT